MDSNAIRKIGLIQEVTMNQDNKIGILTTYLDFDKNYGGILQAYALSSILNSIGYDAYIMPYLYEHIPEDKHKGNPIWKIFRKLIHVLQCVKIRGFSKQTKMYKMLLEFVHTQMPIYQRERMTIKDLTSVANDFYAFICGSDQVWSTKLQQNHCDSGMFLKFVPKGVKKISYAPSLGSTLSMDPGTANEFKTALSTFDAISVREKNGQTTIKNMTGLDVPIVLDPTLLMPLEKWEKFCKIPHNLPNKYILLYRFGGMQYFDEAIEAIRKEYDMPIIELPSSNISLADGYNKRYDINPAEFLGIVKNATLVLTDSFHCTVFSILMHTQFLTFYRQSPDLKYNMNGRVDDLLELTQLTRQLVKPGMDYHNRSILEEEFANAYCNIEQKRKLSYEFLRKALQ